MTSLTLAAWIDARMSRTEFARLTGMSPSHLSLVISGERGLSLKQAVAIEAATKGAVSMAALLEQRSVGTDQNRLGRTSQRKLKPLGDLPKSVGGRPRD